MAGRHMIPSEAGLDAGLYVDLVEALEIIGPAGADEQDRFSVGPPTGVMEISGEMLQLLRGDIIQEHLHHFREGLGGPVHDQNLAPARIKACVLQRRRRFADYVLTRTEGDGALQRDQSFVASGLSFEISNRRGVPRRTASPGQLILRCLSAWLLSNSLVLLLNGR